MVDGQPRAGATLGHPNTLGCFLSVGILILLSLKAREGMNNLLFYAGILLAAVGTFLVLYSKEASEAAAVKKPTPSATAPEVK